MERYIGGKKDKLKNGGRIVTREKREEQSMKKGHLNGEKDESSGRRNGEIKI